MSKVLLGAAFVALVGVGSAASAGDTLQSSTTTMDCTETGCLASRTSALEPFGASLGQLTGILLQVTGSKTLYFAAGPRDSNSPGSIEWSFSGPMTVNVNGETYSFDVGGGATIPVLEYSRHYRSTVSGSGSFEIDPSLFSSFIGTSEPCYPPALVGVCVNGDGPGFADASFTFNNVGFTTLDAEVDASYTLTYSYIPFGAVPEPSTWAMMLLGLGFVGLFARNRRAGRVAPQR